MAKRGSKPGNGPDSHAGNGKHVVLTFDPHNANTHSNASLGAVRRSVDRLGAGRSIVADASGTLIAGEATLRAAQDLGVPVRIIETDGSELVAVVRTDMGPDDPRRHALAIADNQTARLSEFDPQRLADSLRGLGDYQDLLEATGFDADAIADMLTPDTDEPADAEPQVDRAAELAKQWGTAAGQLWLLGEHRLLCGDCRKPEDVARAVGDWSVNVAFTSPPYASQRKYDEASGFVPIKPDDYVAWWEPVQANVRKHLAADGSFFVNIKPHCEDGERVLYVFDLVCAMVRKHSWKFVDELCWKNSGTPKAVERRFKNQFEPVYHFTTEHEFRFRPDAVKVPTDREFVGDGRSMAPQQGVGECVNPVIEPHEGMAYPGNVVAVNFDKANSHAAAFPVGLPSFFIRAFSDEGDVILDPFMGSGTTSIAAENHKRRSVGCEISPKYCAVILQRFKDAFPDAEIRRATP